MSEAVGDETVVGTLIGAIRQQEALKPETIASLRIILTDAIATALSADDTPAARSVVRLAESAPEGPATVFGVARGVQTETAAFANSTRVHALLMDDSHPGTLLHAGTAVLPVALALAEEVDASAELLLTALAAGYEVMSAVAAPISTETAMRGLRNVSLFAPTGAAAAAGVLLGLDDRRMAAAILSAIGAGGGTLQAFRSGSPEWRWQPALGGQAGLAAARLAAVSEPELLDVALDAIESPTGFYRTLVGHDVDWREAMLASIGDGVAGVTHKVHATCGANQGAISALAAILRREQIAPERIVRIEAHVSQMSFDYPGCESYGPFNEEGTFLSRPFALAALVLDGGPHLRREVARRALDDPRLSEMMSRVTSKVAADGVLAHDQHAYVEVELDDGRILAAGAADTDPGDLRPDLDGVRRKLELVAPGVAAALAPLVDALPSGTARNTLAPLRAQTFGAE